MAQIAKVVAITGEVTVTGIGGQTRALKLGDVIESRETLTTQAGAHVELLLADGQRLAMDPGQSVRLDDSLTQTEATPTAQEAALQAATPAGILEMLQQGGDLSTQLQAPAAGSAVVDQEDLLKVLQQGGDLQAALDATAAGLTAGGDGGGGSSFVRLLRIVEGVEPLSYSYSIGGLPQIEEVELGSVTTGAEVTVSSVTSDRQTEGVPLVHTVTLSGVVDHELSFAYSLKGSTATEGSDYKVPPTFSDGVTLVNGQLVVPAGVSSFTITTATVNDTLDENDEYYSLSVGGVGATGTIVDNDTPTVKVGDPNGADGNTNDIVVPEGTAAVFAVKLTGVAEGGTLTLGLDPSGAHPASEGPAAGSDYKQTTFEYSLDGGTSWHSATEGTAFAVNPGDSQVLVRTDTVNDSVDEYDETFTLSATLGSLGVNYSDSGVATIVDDDVPVASVSVSPASVNEDGATNLVYTVTLDQAPVVDTVINLSWSGTATAGVDFSGTRPSTITVLAGQTTGSTTVTIDPTPDTVDEPDETVIATINSGSGYTIGTGSATGTIADDDTTPLIGDGLSHVSEGGLPGGIKDGPSDSATDLTGTLDLTRNGAAPLTVELVNPVPPPKAGETSLSWAYGDGGANHAVLIGSDGTGAVIRVTLNGGSINVGGSGTTVPYTVELLKPIQHSGTGEGAAGEDTTSLNLTVSISDGVNPPDTGTISILIKDDSPQANPDADSLSSDSLVAETGNVITGAGTAGGLGGSGADLAGADGGPVVTGVVAGAGAVTPGVGVETVLNGSYGQLKMAADGGYSYKLYTSGATVAELKALDVGESRTDTFSYQIKDGDKDTSSTTLTFTVNGVNDPPTIIKVNDALDPTRVGNDLVYESNLPAGTNPAPLPPGGPDRYATGTLILQDPDGLHDIQVVRFQTNVNGVETHDFTAAQLGSITSGVPASYQSFATQNGTVTLIAYDTSTGVISYRFELTSPTKDEQTPVDKVEKNEFTVATRDESLDYSPAVTVTVEIVDDVPKAQRDPSVAVPTLVLDESATSLLPSIGGHADGIVTDSKNFSGNFKPVVYGADGPASANSLVYSLQLNGSDVESGLYALDPKAADGKGQQILLTQSGDTIYGKAYGLVYFEISVVASGADAGQVTFTLKGNGNFWHEDKSNPDDPAILNLAPGDLRLEQKVTDGDGDDARAYIDLGQGVFSIQDDGPVANTFPPGQAVDTTGHLWNDIPFGTDGGRSVSITVENSSYTWSKDTNSIAVTGTGGDHGLFDAASHLLQVTLASGDTFSVDMDDGRYTLDLLTTNVLNLDVGYQLVDKDGDSAGGTLHYGTLPYSGTAEPGLSGFSLTGTSGNDVLFGGANDDRLDGADGNDLLRGGKGSDTMTGGPGADTFVWRSTDYLGGTYTDTIKGFGNGQDMLDLRDLLQGEHASPGSVGNLEQYLHFSTQPTPGGSGTDTVIKVTVNGGNPGGTNPSDMTIVLEGVTLAGADDAAKIAALLASNRLLVDH